MTVNLRLLVIVASGAVVLRMSSACQLVGGYADFDHGPCSGAKTPDTPGGPTMAVARRPDGTCFWVDKTEVTVGQYRMFVADSVTSPPSWSSSCSWKSGDGGTPSDPFPANGGLADYCLIPPNEAPATDPNKPIRCVDWCDAEQFCKWSGKRLCSGALNTGATWETDGGGSELVFACQPDQKALPYGDEYRKFWCNVDQQNPPDGGTGCPELKQHGVVGYVCGPWEVGTRKECAPGVAGPLDLIGNVAEWVLLCQMKGNDAGPATDQCEHFGGAYLEPPEAGPSSPDAGPQDARCAFQQGRSLAPRNERAKERGFRCCHD